MEQSVKLFNNLKSGAITLMATGTAILGSLSAYHAIASDTVTVEPLRVPKAFKELGFNSEVSTARLLDEVTSISRRQSSSAK